MGTTNATWPAFPHSRLYSRSDSPMAPAVTDTRMPKARTVWRHFQVFASFALYQVDCPTADKRVGRAGSAVFSTLVLEACLKRERNCAQPFLHIAKSVSHGRVRSMRGHGTAGTGCTTKMAAHHPAPGRCSLCTRAVTTRQATKTPGPICRYGQATGSLSAKRHVPNP
jgi:hypothetical protein